MFWKMIIVVWLWFENDYSLKSIYFAIQWWGIPGPTKPDIVPFNGRVSLDLRTRRGWQFPGETRRARFHKYRTVWLLYKTIVFRYI